MHGVRQETGKSPSSVLRFGGFGESSRPAGFASALMHGITGNGVVVEVGPERVMFATSWHAARFVGTFQVTIPDAPHAGTLKARLLAASEVLGLAVGIALESENPGTYAAFQECVCAAEVGDSAAVNSEHELRWLGYISSNSECSRTACRVVGTRDTQPLAMILGGITWHYLCGGPLLAEQDGTWKLVGVTVGLVVKESVTLCAIEVEVLWNWVSQLVSLSPRDTIWNIRPRIDPPGTAVVPIAVLASLFPPGCVPA